MLSRHRIHSTLLVTIVAVCSATAFCNQQEDTKQPAVPGVVIDHQPASSGKYIGSPSIAILPDGNYVASHDIFGPKSRYSQSKVFLSEDRGRTWRHISDIDGALWNTLFVHRGALYFMGASSRYGNTVIRRSSDGGTTWTTPKDADSGLLLDDGQYHCAPQPVLVHCGRIWRAMEDSRGPTKGWGKHFRAFMMSAPVDADLLRADSWTISNRVAGDTKWLDGQFGGWLEGNAVPAPDGSVVNILRVEYPTGGGKAAMIDVSPDGQTATFAPKTGFIDMPGGCVKFTIRFDPISKCYWSLSNYMPPRHIKNHPGATRNTLALVRSSDLRQWEVRSIIAYHHDVKKHGFQYPDWQFEGDDIIAVSRTAYDDGLGGAHNFHDANFLTFHRIADFRHANDLELPPMPPRKRTTAACTEFKVEGYDFEIGILENDAKAYTNRNYVWKDVPKDFQGWRFTRSDGGVPEKPTVTALSDTVIYATTGSKQEGTDTTGWEVLEGVTFKYSTKHGTPMLIMSRSLKKGEALEAPQTNWSGTMILIPPKGD